MRRYGCSVFPGRIVKTTPITATPRSIQRALSQVLAWWACALEATRNPASPMREKDEADAAHQRPVQYFGSEGSITSAHRLMPPARFLALP